MATFKELPVKFKSFFADKIPEATKKLKTEFVDMLNKYSAESQIRIIEENLRDLKDDKAMLEEVKSDIEKRYIVSLENVGNSTRACEVANDEKQEKLAEENEKIKQADLNAKKARQDAQDKANAKKENAQKQAAEQIKKIDEELVKTNLKITADYEKVCKHKDEEQEKWEERIKEKMKKVKLEQERFWSDTASSKEITAKLAANQNEIDKNQTILNKLQNIIERRKKKYNKEFEKNKEKWKKEVEEEAKESQKQNEEVMSESGSET